MICHQTKAISWGCYCSVSPTPPCIMCFYSFTKRLATEKKKSFGNLAKKSFSFKAMVEAELISMLRWIIVKTCPFVSMILYIGHLSPVKTTYLPKLTLKIMTLGFFFVDKWDCLVSVWTAFCCISVFLYSTFLLTLRTQSTLCNMYHWPIHTHTHSYMLSV